MPEDGTTGATVVGWILLAFLVGGVLWAVLKARKGYGAVQALMAQVEASAEAKAEAAARAENVVQLHVGDRREARVDVRAGRFDELTVGQLGVVLAEVETALAARFAERGQVYDGDPVLEAYDR